MDSFFDWAFQLWLKWMLWIIIPWSILAIGMGALVLILSTITAIRHYGFGKPSYVWENGLPAEPAKVVRSYLMGGGTGAFFMVLGILLLRWQTA